MPHQETRRVVVIGAGMVARRFAERLLRRGGPELRLTVIGDEGRPPYDRASLAGLLADAHGGGEEQSSFPEDPRLRLHLDDRVVRLDRGSRAVRTRSRAVHPYDTLVLATGAHQSRVAVEGAGLPGCFGFRTLDDVEQLSRFVRRRRIELGRELRAAVIGGGVRGLEVAGALQARGIETTVVEYADRLLAAQLDATAAALVKRRLTADGMSVRTTTRVTRIDPDRSGAVTAIEYQDGSFQRVDLVVFTVGMRPRDELARNARITVDPHGGVLIDDGCATSDPAVLAIGDVAVHAGRVSELLSTGYAMADVAVDRLAGGTARLVVPGTGPTAMRFSGVEVVSFGDALTATPDAVDVLYADPVTGVYRKLVLSADTHTLLGGILVGDASAYGALRPLLGTRLEEAPSTYVLPRSG